LRKVRAAPSTARTPPTVEQTHEQEAVEAAKFGKPKELADYLEIEAHHLKTARHEYVLRLTPATLRLVAEFLRGDRNLKTGRAKGEKQRGRAKMSAKERAIKNPVHDAARFDFPAVMQVLREEYRGHRAEHYRDRAIAVVERMTGVKKKTLRNYLNRPKRGRQRL
jgi:hypothetical protein